MTFAIKHDSEKHASKPEDTPMNRGIRGRQTQRIGKWRGGRKSAAGVMSAARPWRPDYV
jgi:hypothetical protein